MIRSRRRLKHITIFWKQVDLESVGYVMDMRDTELSGDYEGWFTI
jgi:hypothetical protein